MVATGTHELVALFVGDAETQGYASPKLVIAICKRYRPPDLNSLRGRIYPGVDWDDLSPIAAQAIKDGWAAWVAAGKPHS